MTPVEVDTAIAAKLQELVRLNRALDAAETNLRYAAGQSYRRNTSGYEWTGTFTEAYGIARAFDLARYVAAAEDVQAKQWEIEELEDQYTGWSRFWLVTNTNGHIHSTTSCSTCYPSTQFAWLPELSGQTEAEAVAAQGEILCSVCFPSAPVAWTTGVRKVVADARADRDAKRAAAAARKADKALGTTITYGRSERIETIAAAKAFLTDELEMQGWGYGRTEEVALIPVVAEALATRLGTTAEAEIEAARKRVANRAKRR